MDQLITTAILIASHSLFFLAGLAVANHYNDKSEYERKDALERQYLRLKAGADADDPCKPYKPNYKRGYWFPSPVVGVENSGFEQPLPSEFEQKLKTTGQATALLKNKRTADK